MGVIKIINAAPLATIQDFGRFGYRRYGIPQCGAMDREAMIFANRLLGNNDDNPVIEYALGKMKFRAESEVYMSIVGADWTINNITQSSSAELKEGDELSVSKPNGNYAYLAIDGLVKAQHDFESYSTDVRAGFGGFEGRQLQKGDLLEVTNHHYSRLNADYFERQVEEVTNIKIMKGPEWGILKELPQAKTFQVHHTSDRMGIRLEGSPLESNYSEITSSAVVPGTIQLPPNGKPIILMNDCQTTGGYPRIGKIIDSDLGKLAQLRPGKSLKLAL